MCSFKQFRSRLKGLPKVAGSDCRWKGKLFSKIPMCKYYFQTKLFPKNNLLVKTLKALY